MKTFILVQMVKSKKGSSSYNPIDEGLDEAEFKKRLKALMEVRPKPKKKDKTKKDPQIKK